MQTAVLLEGLSNRCCALVTEIVVALHHVRHLSRNKTTQHSQKYSTNKTENKYHQIQLLQDIVFKTQRNRFGALVAEVVTELHHAHYHSHNTIRTNNVTKSKQKLNLTRYSP